MTNEQQRRYRANRIKRGQCIECKNKAVHGKRRCKGHLKRDSKRHDGRSTALYFQRKEAGLCVGCGKAKSGRFLKCQDCRLDLSATNSRKKSIEKIDVPHSRSDAHLPTELEAYKIQYE